MPPVEETERERERESHFGLMTSNFPLSLRQRLHSDVQGKPPAFIGAILRGMQNVSLCNLFIHKVGAVCVTFPLSELTPFLQAIIAISRGPR